MKAKLIATLVLGLILLALLVQNAGVVTIRFLFWKSSMSQAVLVLSVLGGGFLAGFLVAAIRHHR
jgi:uncharacterized integral membrane protein